MREKILKKIKKRPVVIEGFPGFGLIGSIVTEFLIGHMSCEKLDDHYFEDLPANIAIHDGKLVEPIGIYYNERFNIVIIHSILPSAGIEWKAADFVLDICTKVSARELISIEGVGSGEESKGRTFFFSTDNRRSEELKSIGLKPMKEGIIMGVTSALLLKKNLPVTCIFGEANAGMPDNNAAAKIVEVLDKMIGLNVDPKPLKQSAKEFEEKFKAIFSQMQTANDEKDKKMLSYVG
ncbi:proteasome assembly chaperone family protein [Candidatus Woesearchaeota archaeon]|nr:proteasome assembly chaperone family protein [Candidatus Woesearchaeota archaeon]